ncbi:MAG: cytochrome P450 [Acidimicrobiales bacterium]
MTRTPGELFVDPAAWADMDAWHARVAELRRTDPVLYVEAEEFEPFWALTRHADVFAVERDDQRWLNTPFSVLGPKAEIDELLASGMPLPASLVHLDGQKHRQHRQVANDWFKPAAVGRRQPRIDEIADTFIERMRELGGACDYAADIAAPYTLHVIMDIYGVPESDAPLMLELTQGLFGAADPEYLGDAADPQEKLLSAVMQYIAYFNEITADRRACPRDDLATVIANGEIDGCTMADLERLWYYIIVATAGHDTTSFALSGGMEALLRDPDQLWAVRDDPELINNAADEMIRWTSPVRHFLRYATEESEVHGVTIPKGGRVLLSYPSANRDEDVFADAMTFDVRRGDVDKLIAFGVGAHFCLGAQFARRELRTMIGKLAQQLDHIELAGEAQWAQSHFVSGVKHLPVSYRFK